MIRYASCVWELPMPTTFRAYQPDQPLLLPPDLQEWVPPGHLAHCSLLITPLTAKPLVPSRKELLSVLAELKPLALPNTT